MFHKNGQLFFSVNFIEHKSVGLRESFYENGQLWVKGYWRDDKPVGLREYFDERGNLTKTEEYKNGVLQE